MDNGSPSLLIETFLDIVVGNINEPPNVQSADFRIPENSAANSYIGIMPTDAQAGVALDYQITAGNINNTFRIQNCSGIIFVNGVVNYEVLAFYNLTITITGELVTFAQAIIRVSGTLLFVDHDVSCAASGEEWGVTCAPRVCLDRRCKRGAAHSADEPHCEGRPGSWLQRVAARELRG